MRHATTKLQIQSDVQVDVFFISAIISPKAVSVVAFFGINFTDYDNASRIVFQVLSMQSGLSRMGILRSQRGVR
jgi:hypothetical protein